MRRLQAATRTTLRNLQHFQTLDYALMLLRYHSPGFDELTLEERADLIAETCVHMNEFVEVLHKLMRFLEQGKPKRRGPAATRVASIRQIVESVYDKLFNMFGLWRERPHELSGASASGGEGGFAQLLHLAQ